MTEYKSIKEEVLKKLEDNLPEIRERFGIESIGVFGSVSRKEDTENSDVDILYKFKAGTKTYHAMLDLADYLEKLFGRHVDMVSSDWINPYLKPYIETDVIMCGCEKGEA